MLARDLSDTRTALRLAVRRFAGGRRAVCLGCLPRPRLGLDPAGRMSGLPAVVGIPPAERVIAGPPNASLAQAEAMVLATAWLRAPVRLLQGSADQRAVRPTVRDFPNAPAPAARREGCFEDRRVARPDDGPAGSQAQAS